MLEQQPWITEEEEELGRLNAEIDQIVAQLDDERRRLGLEENQIELGNLESSPAELISKLRPAARALRNAQANHAEIKGEIRRGEEAERALIEQIGALF